MSSCKGNGQNDDPPGKRFPVPVRSPVLSSPLFAWSKWKVAPATDACKTRIKLHSLPCRPFPKGCTVRITVATVKVFPVGRLRLRIWTTFHHHRPTWQREKRESWGEENARELNCLTLRKRVKSNAVTQRRVVLTDRMHCTYYTTHSAGMPPVERGRLRGN